MKNWQKNSGNSPKDSGRSQSNCQETTLAVCFKDENLRICFGLVVRIHVDFREGHALVHVDDIFAIEDDTC